MVSTLVPVPSSVINVAEQKCSSAQIVYIVANEDDAAVHPSMVLLSKNHRTILVSDIHHQDSTSLLFIYFLLMPDFISRNFVNERIVV